ncbi:MAG TPA: M15 family metallopeptidase [Pseudolysinimonas sp.]|nr:M15 family metallopeptidase [Pseudolysinimonas sp.]
MSRGVRIAAIAGASLAVVLILVIVIVVLAPSSSIRPTGAPTPTPTSTPSPTPTPTPTPTFDTSQLSIDDAASLWVVANKTRPLNPKNYAPVLTALNLPGGGEMRPEAAAALRQMFADYQAQSGAQLRVVSAYRSYTTQVATYNGWVSRLGQAQADRQSARPGTSEHQTGLAVDINTGSDQGFGATPAGTWLAANSYKYGFIVRYPDGFEPITGYEYEPWHFRFIGVDLATEMHTTGVQTLEQFFGLPAAPDYPN